MSDDISLLPEELRKKEDALKSNEPIPSSGSSELRFSTPVQDGDDVEVIEIDEGDVDQVLATEPSVSKLIYRVTTFFQDLFHKLFQPQIVVQPPKLPPQFFTPKTASPAVPGAPAASPQKTPTSNVSISPYQQVPRRVRVIKRIRKPVRVSFVSDDDLRLMRIDIPRRRFTFIVLSIVFAILLGGGAYALRLQRSAAEVELAKADTQLSDVRQRIQAQQGSWSSFQNLEPLLKALSVLLDRHVSPTTLFQDIEKTTLPSVYYESLSFTPDLRVTLLTVADSFQSAAEQVAAFQSAEFVKKVEASGYSVKYESPTSIHPSRVEFQLILTLADKALIVGSTPVAATP